ncbi:hypothetical protein GDO81_009035 [Engystomops pustulosus]|uniref:Uncharacterized protein n=1 Tax=Engystomops pustulosus TaxID=76066 RepID=A0AAV7BN69_ENGPU|nr:hypothetical protein GDO81_009035 [Engystomops pustulosus]
MNRQMPQCLPSDYGIDDKWIMDGGPYLCRLDHHNPFYISPICAISVPIVSTSWVQAFGPLWDSPLTLKRCNDGGKNRNLRFDNKLQVYVVTQYCEPSAK